MKKSIIIFVSTLLFVLVLSACGKKEYKSVAIEEGVDKCPICNMLVADDQYATEIILTNHKALKFDDLGDLFVWRSQNDIKTIGEQYVRDYNSKEWIRLADATYVYDKSIRTPMAYNVISFKKSKDADDFVQKEGKGIVISSEQLMDHKWEVNEDMMNSMMDTAAGEMKKQMDHMDQDETMQMDGGESSSHSPEASASSSTK